MGFVICIKCGEVVGAVSLGLQNACESILQFQKRWCHPVQYVVYLHQPQTHAQGSHYGFKGGITLGLAHHLCSSLVDGCHRSHTSSPSDQGCTPISCFGVTNIPGKGLRRQVELHYDGIMSELDPNSCSSLYKFCIMCTIYKIVGSPAVVQPTCPRLLNP